MKRKPAKKSAAVKALPGAVLTAPVIENEKCFSFKYFNKERGNHVNHEILAPNKQLALEALPELFPEISSSEAETIEWI